MATYKDYYDVLGVKRGDNEKDIKKAYRKLARQYHPDVNPGDKQSEERFKEINEAYEVLGDKEKRTQYDRLGSQYQQWQQMGGQGSVPWDDLMNQAGVGGMGGMNYNTADTGAFSDFFDTLFGGSGGRPGGGPRVRTQQSRRTAIKGRDIEHEVEITLEEAYQGTTRNFNRNGRRLAVTIPPGAKNGTRVRVSGKGDTGYAGGPPGDLFLVVKVQEDNTYERKDANLYRDVSLDLYTAVLGGEINVPTLSGSVRLKIPPGTNSGQRFRLGGKGMPTLRDKNILGDLYVRMMVQVPDDLTGEELALFERLSTMRD